MRAHADKRGPRLAGLALVGLVLVAVDLWAALERRPTAGRLSAWAGWIGEVPTAAELYGEAASEVPSSEAFEDDDDDEELDASATNEYPDNENDADEAYEDAEDADNQESRRQEHWLRPHHRTPAARVGGHAIWSDLEGWRRNKRDIEDRLVLASRRAARRRRRPRPGEDPDLEQVDDGDEDAWVHDGVDDIHIDPETKRAASELAQDERSIDAEYEPAGGPAPNRTRITTIAEVIPLAGEPAAEASSQPEEPEEPEEERSYLLPASMLTLEQVLSLHAQRRQRRHLAAERGRPSSRAAPPDGARRAARAAPARAAGPKEDQ